MKKRLTALEESIQTPEKAEDTAAERDLFAAYRNRAVEYGILN